MDFIFIIFVPFFKRKNNILLSYDAINLIIIIIIIAISKEVKESYYLDFFKIIDERFRTEECPLKVFFLNKEVKSMKGEKFLTKNMAMTLVIFFCSLYAFLQNTY